MQSLRKISYYCLIILLICISGLHSEIKKKVSQDGTIHYSNRAEKRQGAFKKTEFKSPYNALIEEICSAEGVDQYLVKCIIKVESGFKSDAVSVAGAMGLMQIMQDVARCYNVADPFNPRENITAGTKHLKSLLDFLQNDVTLAVAAYHAGLGRVKRNMKIPPIQSTIEYVDNVMFLYNGGKESSSEKIRKLYKRINKDGVIELYNN